MPNEDAIQKRRSSDPVYRVLQEEYQASRWHGKVIASVLGMPDRTAYNRLEGITPLSPAEILELTIELGSPRLLNAYLKSRGSGYRLRLAIHVEGAPDLEAIAQAMVDGYAELCSLYEDVRDALADGRITPTERRRIRRHIDVCLQKALAAPMGIIGEGEAITV